MIIFTGSVPLSTSMPTVPISSGVATFDCRSYGSVILLATLISASGASGNTTVRIEYTHAPYTVADSDATWRSIGDDWVMTPVSGGGVLTDKTSHVTYLLNNATRVRVFGVANADSAHAVTLVIEANGCAGNH